ncbi:ABC transporter permease subunit [Nonomuraea sp. NPDC052116]|uniref:ABC transporter permease n=1 Tax=Nonomuraea sp. NPDC052116 TaxID=3155665 RepID=UPI003431FA17
MAVTLADRRTDDPPTSAAGSARRRGGRRQRLRRSRLLLLMMAPGVLYFLVFHYVALLGNVIVFQDYLPFAGIANSPWVGLDNFRTLFADPDFWQAAVNTVSLATLQLIFYFPVPVVLALLLHSLTRGWVRKAVQSIVYLPHFISWVIVVALFQQLLGAAGVLNGLFADNGYHLVNVFSEPSLFKPLMIAELIWKDCGWGTIIVLAALHNVDDQLYEASAIDGAGWGRRLWHVTLPSLRPVLVLLLILRLGDILSVGFDQVLLQRDGFSPGVAEVLDTYTYYHGVVNGSWGPAALAGIFKGLVGLVLIVVANKVAHRLGEEGVYR